MADAVVPPRDAPANILCRQWTDALAAYQTAADAFDEHYSEKHDRMCELIDTPAPDLPALARKLELVCREYFALTPAWRGIAETLVADSRRLIRR